MKYIKNPNFSEKRALELAGNLLTPDNPLSRAIKLPVYSELSMLEFSNSKWAKDQDKREQLFTKVYEPWYNSTFGLEDSPKLIYWFCYPSHAINALKSQYLGDRSTKTFILEFVNERFPDASPSYQAHIRDMCLRFFAEVCYYTYEKELTGELLKGVAIKVATKHLYFLSEYYANGDVFKLFSEPEKWPKCFAIAILECLKCFN